MPKLKIDHREVEVPPGATVLDAARALGIDIPTLCFRDGCEAATSCLVCLVKIAEHRRLVPACATAAAEGMEVESETAEVRQFRRSALELLLSDHLGDCLAPCWFTCPAHMDIPQMLRQVAAGQLHEAIATVKRDIALPAVLGRICPAPCEKSCRRSALDAGVTIGGLERYVADADLATAEPYRPPCQPATGKRVAIVGAGPTGLAAAWHLAQQGHACTLFDENERPGGRLRRESAEKLPAAVLDAEIATIVRLGVELRCGTRVEGNVGSAEEEAGDCPDFRPTKMGLSPSRTQGSCVGRSVSLAELRHQYDAVLIACGAMAPEAVAGWGLPTGPQGHIAAAKETGATAIAGVFAAGNAVRGKGLVVRSVADGKAAAVAIDQFLSGRPVQGSPPQFSTKMGRLEQAELVQLASGTGEGTWCTQTADTGFTAEEAAGQATRCMHCDCRGLRSCRLRHYAALYGADPRRYPGPRRSFQQDARHAEVIFEPGKCIDCGLCIQIAASAGETLGLSFVGRGFDVRVAVPFDRSLAEALGKVAAACVAACPTAALAWKDAASYKED